MIIVIPARLESKRLPNKPLVMIRDKPLLYWTYNRALNVTTRVNTRKPIVATSDKEIVDYCRDNKIECIKTSNTHVTGTDRVAEAVETLRANEEIKYAETVINWQVDEPSIASVWIIRRLMNFNQGMSSSADVATLISIIDEEQLNDPNTTKVVCSNERCHWFSRVAIPGSFGHCGIYAYSASTLRLLSMTKPSRLSQLESLEQLAWIEDGFKIKPYLIPELPISIDTQEDVNRYSQEMRIC